MLWANSKFWSKVWAGSLVWGLGESEPFSWGVEVGNKGKSNKDFLEVDMGGGISEISFFLKMSDSSGISGGAL